MRCHILLFAFRFFLPRNRAECFLCYVDVQCPVVVVVMIITSCQSSL